MKFRLAVCQGVILQFLDEVPSFGNGTSPTPFTRGIKFLPRKFRREVQRKFLIFNESELLEALKLYLNEMRYRASGGSFISLPAMRY